MALFAKRKKDAATTDSDSLCMILSRALAPPANKQVAKALDREFGSSAKITDSKDGVWMLDLPEAITAFLSYIPAPIPEQEAEAAAAGNILWPEGEVEVAKHRSHVIVGVLGSESDRATTLMTLSRLAACVLNTFNGIGIYWGSGHVANSKETFMELLKEASTESLPLSLWIRYQPFENEDKSLGFYTLGLEQFGLMNIEVDRCLWQPMKLLEFIFDISHHLVNNGPVINDGDTVGEDENQRIHVKYAASMHDKKTRVYKILME